MTTRSQGNALIFTHISPHARLEIPTNLRDPCAFSPPLPEYRARGARAKDVGKDEPRRPWAKTLLRQSGRKMAFAGVFKLNET